MMANNENGNGGGFGTMTSYYDIDVTVEDLYVSGNYAYVTAKTYGVYIIDISDPENPTQAGVWDKTKGQAWNVFVKDNYMYVADKHGGMAIVDVSDPKNPKDVGRYDNGYDVEEVVVDGNYAYLAGGTGKYGVLIILDISDPKNPTEVCVDTVSQEALLSITYNNNIVYAGGGRGTLYIFDVSNKQAPQQIATYYNEGDPGFKPWGLGVTYADSKLFFSDWGAGLIILDVSDPKNPKELSVFYVKENRNGFYDCAVVGNRAYAANSWGGLAVVDISDASNPMLVDSLIAADIEKTIEKPSYHGVCVKGDYAYVVDNGEQILSIINIKE